MLSELRVSQLGVIEDLTLVLGPGMTALTGETGAGKTLVVEAIELLLGGRAEGVLVRPGRPRLWLRAASCCRRASSNRALAMRAILLRAILIVVERARQVQRAQRDRAEPAVPADGRSRAYLDGRMASVGALAELGERLVDLHGQHAHQSLLSGAAQRDALDSYAGTDRPAA